jgi:hypothetical protein
MRWPPFSLDVDAEEASTSPTFREVVHDIGITLAAHLAIAFAVVVGLRMLGIG